jgi:GntR family transcriptional regulator, transcriptional repressor for pyruvate dehydrogenase complex
MTENGRRIQRAGKLAESVAHDIARRIRVEKLAPGTHLASETEMLADYGVGRASLREALRVLEVHGLISIKPGPRGGPIIGDVNPGDFGRMSTLYFQFGHMTYRDLMEARQVMESVMAGMAARRGDPKSVADLVASGNNTDVTDDEAYLRSSNAFHRLIAGASGNKILSLFALSLEGIFHDRVTSFLFPPKRRGRVAEAHRAIAAAIEAGDEELAEELMWDHMEEYAAYVRRRHPALMDEVVDWR